MYRVCVETFKYVNKDTGLCKECPSAILPVIIFLVYLCAIVFVLILLYVLIRWSSPVLKRSAQAVRWVAALNARSFKQQGPAKFRVRPALAAPSTSHGHRLETLHGTSSHQQPPVP